MSILGVKNWLFLFTLPRSGIPIIVFVAHLGIRFPHLWRVPCVSWRLAGCELAHSHAMKHLRLVSANFAYQIIVVR